MSPFTAEGRWWRSVIGLGSTIVLALSLAVTTLVLRTVPAAGADA